MSAATVKREAVATAIRSGLESLDGAWAAYASPVDIVSFPAVVIAPGDPYREPITYGDFGTGRERIRLSAFLFLNRATGNTALDIFDTAQDAVFAAIDAVTYSTSWSRSRALGEVTVGTDAAPALGFSIDLEVV